MFYLWILLGSVLLGLALLAIGAVLLFGVKKKKAGIIFGVAGLVFILVPVAALLFLLPIRAQG